MGLWKGHRRHNNDSKLLRWGNVALQPTVDHHLIIFMTVSTETGATSRMTMLTTRTVDKCTQTESWTIWLAKLTWDISANILSKVTSLVTHWHLVDIVLYIQQSEYFYCLCNTLITAGHFVSNFHCIVFVYWNIIIALTQCTKHGNKWFKQCFMTLTYR